MAGASAPPHASRRTAFTLCLLLLAQAARAQDSESSRSELRWLDPSAADYRTPRAGEGFRTHIFGRDVEVPPRDRRSVSAVDVGAAAWYRWPEDEPALPFGSLYFWRRPDDQSFFRGTVVFVYNDLLYTHALAPRSPFEFVLGFQSSTIPSDQAEYADGERIAHQELLQGDVRGAIGVGYRRQVEAGFGGLRIREGVNPKAPDNMFSLDATLEPEFLYFREGRDDSRDFTVPGDTFALRGHLALRWDALERNLLDLSHRGFALGIDAWQGWRARWRDWGIDRGENAGDGREPRLLQAYGVAAAGLPGVASERHRLIGSLHAGWGGNLDRFSEPSVGGGPSGDEFLSLSRPIVPGAAIGEFLPDHYAVAIAEYRYELFFFTYLSARASAAWLDRERLNGSGIHRENDALTSIGTRLTTGFLFKTRLQLDYTYNFELIRDGKRGASGLVLHVSRSF